ncbi:hypothetical protein D3C73_943560 [compost metagenome]
MQGDVLGRGGDNRTRRRVQQTQTRPVFHLISPHGSRTDGDPLPRNQQRNRFSVWGRRHIKDGRLSHLANLARECVDLHKPLGRLFLRRGGDSAKSVDARGGRNPALGAVALEHPGHGADRTGGQEQPVVVSPFRPAAGKRHVRGQAGPADGAGFHVKDAGFHAMCADPIDEKPSAGRRPRPQHQAFFLGGMDQPHGFVCAVKIEEEQIRRSPYGPMASIETRGAVKGASALIDEPMTIRRKRDVAEGFHAQDIVDRQRAFLGDRRRNRQSAR